MCSPGLNSGDFPIDGIVWLFVIHSRKHKSQYWTLWLFYQVAPQVKLRVDWDPFETTVFSKEFHLFLAINQCTIFVLLQSSFYLVIGSIEALEVGVAWPHWKRKCSQVRRNIKDNWILTSANLKDTVEGFDDITYTIIYYYIYTITLNDSCVHLATW